MSYKITSYYGQKESFRSTGHSGIDFSMPDGTPLRAIKDGIIHLKDFGDKNAGKMIKINGEDGKDYIYGHLSKFSVNEGQIVNKGDIIGYSGNTGFSTGSHLHFGVKEGTKFIDPSAYIPDIQNMNQFVTNTQHLIQTKMNFFDFMQQHMTSLSDLKLNLIHFFILSDYIPLIQILKNLVKIFFINI